MKRVKILTSFILVLAMLPALIACREKEGTLPPDHSTTDNVESSIQNPPPVESSPEETPPLEDSVTSEDASTPEETPEEAPPTSTPQPTPPPTVPEQPPQTQKARYIRLTGDRVNLRKGAGTDFAVLTSANEGTMYALTEKNGNWYKTFYRNQVAYVHTSYAAVLSIEKSTDKDVENVIAEGYKLLGTPYVYGAVRFHDGKGKLLAGFSVQKFDCSSLIQYIFYKGAGTLLNVNTRTQVKQGTYVKKSDLQRGDCLFFTNTDRQYNTGIERIGHVALYLGDNYILHTASDYACIEQISAKRWSFFIEARRFL